MPEYEQYKLGDENQSLILDSSSDNYGAALAMLQQTCLLYTSDAADELRSV